MHKKIVSAVLLTSLLLSPLAGFATWQIAGSPVRTPDGQPNKMVLDTPKLYQTNNRYTLVTRKGWLYSTVRDYATKCHWRLSWYAKRNYPLNFATTISGPSFNVVLDRLLAHYPLHAYYNKRTQTVTVRPGHTAMS